MNFEELKEYYKKLGFSDEEAALKAKYKLKLSQEEYNRLQHPDYSKYKIGSTLKSIADGIGLGTTFVNPTIGGAYFVGTGIHLIANGETTEGVTRGMMASLPGAHQLISKINPIVGNWFGAGLSGLFGGTAANDIMENGVNGDNAVQLGLSLLPFTSQVKLPKTTLEIKPQVFYNENGLPVYGNDGMLEVYPNKPILHKYELLTFPGYMLKPLMLGNPLERLLSKDGTISINSLLAYSKKGNAMELEVINKVLLELFNGLKAIDYNTFRKAVLNELILYSRKPSRQYEDYGLSRLFPMLGELEYPNSYYRGNSDAPLISVLHEYIRFLDEKPASNKKILKFVYPNFFFLDSKGRMRYSPESKTAASPWEQYAKEYHSAGSESEQLAAADKYIQKTIIGNNPLEFLNWKALVDQDVENYFKSLGIPHILSTFTFKSPRIPKGNALHYDPTTLGHVRTYTTAKEPDVLHIMESQSDWALSKSAYSDPLDAYNLVFDRMGLEAEDPFNSVYEPYTNESTINWLKAQPDDAIIEGIPKYKLMDYYNEVLKELYSPVSLDAHQKYLKDNYLQRQLQENLRYAAELGYKRMRYPTPETVVKIEGYKREPWTTIEQNQDGLHYDMLMKLLKTLHTNSNYADKSLDVYINRETNPKVKNLLELFKHFGHDVNTLLSYIPEHQTVLKKYEGFPKMYEKLYGKGTTRIVTDSKGNTWYEVDVPLDFLLREILYKLGGKLKMFY